MRRTHSILDCRWVKPSNSPSVRNHRVHQNRHILTRRPFEIMFPEKEPAPMSETLQFKTELKQLLHLIIHSLYSHKDIFLRELISNASDAIDTARFQSLTNADIAEGDTEWKIKITPDEAKGTLTVSDNGIGMSRATIVENLGTIAKSGTRAFLESLKEAKA